MVSTHLKNMLVKLDHFQFAGVKILKIWMTPPPSIIYPCPFFGIRNNFCWWQTRPWDLTYLAWRHLTLCPGSRRETRDLIRRCWIFITLVEYSPTKHGDVVIQSYTSLREKFNAKPVILFDRRNSAPADTLKILSCMSGGAGFLTSALDWPIWFALSLLRADFLV